MPPASSGVRPPTWLAGGVRVVSGPWPPRPQSLQVVWVKRKSAGLGEDGI